MSEQPEPAEKPRSKLATYGVLGAAVIVAIAVGVYLVASGGDSKSTASPGDGTETLQSIYPNTGPLEPARPKIGEKAPDFALADARDTTKVRKLSDFKGKAVVVNWFASWCGPCKEEIPEFQQAQQTLGDQIVFLGVDYQESPESATGILDEFKATYPAVLDDAGKVAAHYRVGQGGGGLPTTFFVDKDGILRGQVTGRVTKEKLEENLAAVGLTYKAP